MDIEYSRGRIVLNRQLSGLDKFVIDFCKILEKHEIGYVIVSGYLSIVFGRSRYTEDVDMIVEQISYEKFRSFWNDVSRDFECINTDNPEEAYNHFLKKYSAVRFSRVGSVFPNMEVKIGTTKDDLYSLSNSIELVLSDNKLIISQIEFHIAYKFYLGSEKDLEDAKFVYKLLEEHIDKNLLLRHLDKLNIDSNIIHKYLGLS